jgi:hypothetical protein
VKEKVLVRLDSAKSPTSYTEERVVVYEPSLGDDVTSMNQADSVTELEEVFEMLTGSM